MANNHRPCPPPVVALLLCFAWPNLIAAGGAPVDAVPPPTDIGRLPEHLNHGFFNGLKLRGGAQVEQRVSVLRREQRDGSFRLRPQEASSNQQAVFSFASLSVNQDVVESNSESSSKLQSHLEKNKSIYIGVSITALVVTIAYVYRDGWTGLLDKKKMQDSAVQALQGLRPNDPNDPVQVFMAFGTYVLAMAAWEFLGLSTIPVETAAGMVFQWPGAIASAAGKLLGASLAFGFGRTQLRQYVVKKLSDNPTCQLLAEQGTRHPAVLSALLMKFSCFPETIKNFGTAAFLPAVNFSWFFFATVVHGVTFTLLWTWLGVETSGQLESTSGAAATTSRGLQLALGAMLLTGFVLSPLSMAWWVQDLRKGAAEKKRREEEEKRKQLFGWWPRRKIQ